MGISQRLCEVRDRDYGGEQKAMAESWGLQAPTLSRWMRRERVPTAIWYSFLAARLGISVSDVHELCEQDRAAREPTIAPA